MSTPTTPAEYQVLDAMLDKAVDSGRFELATGILLATIAIASEDVTAEMQQMLGEKLIELQIQHYSSISTGTKEIFALAGFDDTTITEILNNAKAKSNESGTH